MTGPDFLKNLHVHQLRHAIFASDWCVTDGCWWPRHLRHFRAFGALALLAFLPLFPLLTCLLKHRFEICQLLLHGFINNCPELSFHDGKDTLSSKITVVALIKIIALVP